LGVSSLFLAKNGWIILSLASALFDTSVHLCSKLSIKTLNELAVSSIMVMGASLVCLLLITVKGFWSSEALNNVGPDYFLFAVFIGFVAAVGMILFFRGLKESDISVTIPLLCFSPIFACGWSVLLVGEYPSSVGLVGVVVVLIGAYSMELGGGRKGILAPIKSLFSEKGARNTTIAVLCWSFCAVIERDAVLLVSPMFWSFSVLFFLGLFVMLYGYFFAGVKREDFISALRPITFVLSFSYAMMHVCQMNAIVSGFVPYVLSIKRMAILFSVVLGALIFKEKNLKQRAFGAVLMLVGVCIIALYS